MYMYIFIHKYVCMYMWKCPHVRLRFPCMAYSHCQENMPVETVLRPATNHENPSWETPVSCFQRLKSSTWSKLYQNITMEIHTDSIRFQIFLVLLGVLHAQLPATCLENGYGGYAWIPLKWFDNFRQTTLRHTFRLGRRHPRSKSDWFSPHRWSSCWNWLPISQHPISSNSINFDTFLAHELAWSWDKSCTEE